MRVNWRLAGYESIESTFGTGESARKSMRIRFKFVDVDVEESLEPYVFPVADVYIAYSNPLTDRGTSRWAYWSKSGREVFARAFDIDEDLVGKMQAWAQLPEKLRLPYNSLPEDRQLEVAEEWTRTAHKEGDTLENSFHEAEVPVWKILSVEGATSAATSNGVGGADLYSYMADKAEGKRDQEFYIDLVSDQKVTSDQAVVGMITEQKLVDFLISAQRIHRDPDGILRKGVAGVAA